MKIKRLTALTAAAVMLFTGCSLKGGKTKVTKKPADSGASAVTELESSAADSAPEETVPETTTALTDTDSEEEEPEEQLPTRHTIDVENIMQKPELPYGCEIVSLTIVLQYLGFNVDKVDMADNYLDKISFWRANDELYGADPYEAFPGDPKENLGSGCFAQVIVRAADKFFLSRESNYCGVNTSNTPLEDLFHEYIDKDQPVVIWVTSSNLHDIEHKYTWKTADGRTIDFPSYQHCVVLTGYDTDIGVVYAADPLVGNTAYDMYMFNLRYEELGLQSMVVEQGLE